MNPDTNKFEKLHYEKALEDLEQALKNKDQDFFEKLIRPDGSEVPDHWSTFTVDEKVVIKNYTFKVAYIGETSILFEPVGPVILGEKDE